MRFFEFADDNNTEKFVMILKNLIGRSASKKTPAKFNWNALNQFSKTSGIELAADYETFKAMYDATPVLQALVKNFNDKGVELNVPGAPDSEPGAEQPADGVDAQGNDQIDQIAAANAEKQLQA
jgi:hypothetical protein